MKKCKISKNIWYIALSFISIAILSFILFDLSKANPDYICIKNVYNQPCTITHCDDWKQDWTRLCHWVKATQVAYYLVRTYCEDWYTRVSNWWDSLADSWRQWSDYIYASTSCNIIQEDHVSPVWQWNVTNIN